MDNSVANHAKGFSFTLTNGQVTGESRVFGTHTSSVTIPTNASFSVTSSGITETITGSKSTEVIQFVHDASNANLYHVGSTSHTILNPSTTLSNGATFGYGFTISNNKVTAEEIVRGGSGNATLHHKALHIGPTETFVVNGNTVTETLVYGNVVETIQFVKSGSTGLYAVAQESHTFIQAGTATTHLSVDPYERAKFTLDSSNHITQVQVVHADGSVKTVTPPASTSFSQLAPGYVVETITRNGHSSYEVYHDGNGDGIYTEVAHGSGTTVDLVGLKAQISSVIDAVT